ncbi:hypothetical protein LEP1GSC052_3226 [Leptospira kmetyi serovar Malaysia str. Bejo-Iso9]|nr:hypothetical protein LEP1GSC052_3226 [Leptospira kmetyi serovar Malaysia str. Bejo-Iso9]
MIVFGIGESIQFLFRILQRFRIRSEVAFLQSKFCDSCYKSITKVFVLENGK